MKRPRARCSGTACGLMLLGGVATTGCICKCPPYCEEATLRLVTEEFLPYDSEPPGGRMFLLVEAERPDGDVVEARTTLYYVEGEGLTFYQDFQVDLVVWEEDNETACPAPADVELNFWVLRGDGVVDESFVSHQANAGNSEFELWSGWTLWLDWLPTQCACR